MRNNKLRQIVNPAERILWEGKPNFKCFVLESIFNPMLFLALLWGGIDSFIINAATKTGDEELLFLIFFFALHLMPVWIYLGGVLGCVFNYLNTAYIITDKRIYLSSGIISYKTEIITFQQLANVTIHQGLFDKLIGVGDVELERGFRKTVTTQFNTPQNTQEAMENLKKMYASGTYTSQRRTRSHSRNTSIGSTSEYMKAYRLILKLQDDAAHEKPQENRYGHSDSYF